MKESVFSYFYINEKHHIFESEKNKRVFREFMTIEELQKAYADSWVQYPFLKNIKKQDILSELHKHLLSSGIKEIIVTDPVTYKTTTLVLFKRTYAGTVFRKYINRMIKDYNMSKKSKLSDKFNSMPVTSLKQIEKKYEKLKRDESFI